MTRRSLMQSVAAAFAVLAKMPLAGRAAEVPEASDASVTLGTAAERLRAGQLVWQDKDGRVLAVTDDNFKSVKVCGVALSANRIMHTHMVGIDADKYHSGWS